MLAPELVRFPSCVFDTTELIISCTSIFHLEISPMPAFLLHSEGSSVSYTFFSYPDEIGEVKSFIGGISSLA